MGGLALSRVFYPAESSVTLWPPSAISICGQNYSFRYLDSRSHLKGLAALVNTKVVLLGRPWWPVTCAAPGESSILLSRQGGLQAKQADVELLKKCGRADSIRRLTLPGALDGLQRLPDPGEGHHDAEDLHGAPAHPHHERHHPNVFQGGPGHLPRFLCTNGLASTERVSEVTFGRILLEAYWVES
jgi:hypothetical protein